MARPPRPPRSCPPLCPSPTPTRPCSLTPFLAAALALALAWPSALSALDADLVPRDLRCESRVDPWSVESPRPRLGWTLESSTRGQRQSAYQIHVASTADRLRSGDPDRWDSGRIPSDAQGEVEFGGPPCTSESEYFWKVRVWDKDGTPGPWSPPARWCMGLLDPGDFRARWITAPPASSLPLLRRTFVASRPVRSARVHVSGLGHFDLFLNGRRVGDRFLDPAWSVYEKTVFYVTHDVTDSLRPGTNAFGIMLGKGFFNTAGDRRVHGVQANRPLRLWFQARIQFDDGTEQWILSDGSWKTRPGPITHSAILGGEDHDARLLDPDWCQPTGDDAAWTPALLTDGPGGRLSGAAGPPLKVHAILPPTRIDEPLPGTYVYDFGQNASAIPRLRVSGQAGQVVRLVPAEQRHGSSPRRNDGRGLVNQAGVGHPNYFQYTLRGGAPEEWTPQFTYSGFQYLQIEGAVPMNHPNPGKLPRIESLDSLHVRAAAARVGEFSCSHPLLQRIDTGIDWAVRANLSHVLTDCPHREKLGWLEVAYLMGPSIAGRYDVASFYDKVSRDCADSQAADGRVPTVAPAYPAFSGGFAYTPEWGAAAVLLPPLVDLWYGDRRLLRERFSTMKRFVDFMHATANHLVPVPGLGDWYDYGHGKPVGPSQFTPVELTAMATFHRCARAVADTAARLHLPEDRQRYANLADRIRDAFNQRFFDGQSEYRNSGSPQCANAMALVLDLVPAGRETAVLERLLADLRARGLQQTAGDIGYPYLVEALSRHGRSDVLFDIVTRTNLGSYGFIVNNGWTALPEAWDADTGASMNHCMLGHIQQWFMGNVAGIRPDPDHPGFSRFHVAPEPVGNLSWARGRFASVRGPVESNWTRTAGLFRLQVTIPPNTRASVRLPATERDLIREGGQPLVPSSEIRITRREAQAIILDVASGTYRFDIAGP